MNSACNEFGLHPFFNGFTKDIVSQVPKTSRNDRMSKVLANLTGLTEGRGYLN